MSETATRRTKARLAGAILVVAVAFAVGFIVRGCGAERPAQKADVHGSVSEAAPGAPEQSADIVWTCSMHPQIRLPNPGKCPICFMDLIPVKKSGTGEGSEVSLRQVTLSPEAQKLAQVETAKVVRREVETATRLLGKVDYDETRLSSITARIGGRLDKLYVDYTGQAVAAGQQLADIYSPELQTAQAELIQAAQAARQSADIAFPRVREAAEKTLESAREKLRLWGLTDKQVKDIEERGKIAEHVTIYAPFGGVVIKKDAVEGTYVKTGMPIYTIADLSRVWVMLEAYESDLPFIRLGQQVKFTAEALPGETFSGEVAYIDPLVKEATRTVGVRLNAANKDAHLKPGMFVRALGRAEAARHPELVIPATAPLLTGKRAVVYVAVPGAPGTYEGREIVLGPRAGDVYVVLSGLSEGEAVVTRGNFKIDSAVQIEAKPSMMTPQAGVPAPGHMHMEGMADMAAPVAAGESMPAHAGPARLTSPQGGALAPAVKDIRAATAAGDLPATHEAYTKFYQSLCAIDPSVLTGQDALLWKELTMILKNDAVLGQNSDSAAESRRLLAEFDGHWKRFTAAFSVAAPEEKKAAAGGFLGAPAAVQTQLAGVLAAYFPVPAALAADDLAKAQAALPGLTAALKAVAMEKLATDAHMAWMQDLGTMNGGLKTMAGAKDIEAARAGFIPLSAGLIAALKTLGLPKGQAAYVLFCPMADGGKGALWLQPEKEVKNPFFGAAMLTCGEVREELGK